MKKQYCTWNGVTATVWHLDKGEEVAEHQHTQEHLTMTLAGGCRVYIKDAYRDMASDTGPDTLPRKVPHRIVALEDGTVVLNMSAAGNTPTSEQDTQPAGVMLHDGTVV
jgi:quercetin dioxygenase-like cupin family protein